MYESRIAADQLLVMAIEGFPLEIDARAGRSLSRHGLLRAAWYQGRGKLAAALPTARVWGAEVVPAPQIGLPERRLAHG